MSGISDAESHVSARDNRYGPSSRRTCFDRRGTVCPAYVVGRAGDRLRLLVHKVFGPAGIGVVYGKQEVLEHMPPSQAGGNMFANLTFKRTIFQGSSKRFEAGAADIAAAVGLVAALDYVESIEMEIIGYYEHHLLVYAAEKTRLVPSLTFIGTAAEKASALSFVLDDARAGMSAKRLIARASLCAPATIARSPSCVVSA